MPESQSNDPPARPLGDQDSNPYVSPTEQLVESEHVEHQSLLYGLGDHVSMAFVVPILAGLIGVVVSTVIHLGMIYFQEVHNQPGGNFPTSADALMDATYELVKDPFKLILLTIPLQLCFGFMAVLPSFLSRFKLKDRLGLTMGKLPVWTWICFMLAAPAVNAATMLALGPITTVEDSMSLKLVENIVSAHTGTVSGIALLFLLIAVTPSVCEELMFRGFVQRVLTRNLFDGRAWGLILFGVLCSSVMFGIAHMDFAQGLLVIPLGIWFGVVSWKCKSIVPAMLCHLANNGIGVGLMSSGQSEETIEVWMNYLAIGSIPFLLISIAIFVLVKTDNTGSLNSDK